MMVVATQMPHREELHSANSWPRHLLLVTTSWVTCWSPYAATGFGALFCVTFACLSQVWAYPVPRSLLSDLSISSGALAVYWAGYAVGDRYTRAWHPEGAGHGGAAFIPWLYCAALAALAWGHCKAVPTLIKAVEKLFVCAKSVSAGICNADVSRLTPEVVEAMREFLK